MGPCSMRRTGASSQSPQKPWPFAMRIMIGRGARTSACSAAAPGAIRVPKSVHASVNAARKIACATLGGCATSSEGLQNKVLSWVVFQAQLQCESQDAPSLEWIDDCVEVAGRRGVPRVEPVLIVCARLVDFTTQLVGRRLALLFQFC